MQTSQRIAQQQSAKSRALYTGGQTAEEKRRSRVREVTRELIEHAQRGEQAMAREARRTLNDLDISWRDDCLQYSDETITTLKRAGLRWTP